MDIKKGQKIWFLYTRTRQSEIIESTVKTVGRKYITTDYDDRIKFDRNTLREVNAIGSACKLILDIEEYKKDIYYSKLIQKFQKLGWEDIDRNKLDQISKILNNN